MLGMKKVILNFAVRVIFLQTRWASSSVEELPDTVANAVHFEHVSSFTASALKRLLTRHTSEQLLIGRFCWIWSKDICRKVAMLSELLKDVLMSRHNHKVVGSLHTGVFTCPPDQSFPKWSVVAEQISPGCKVVCWIPEG
jgi:hypothetical protein